jgi:hypothetical protein
MANSTSVTIPPTTLLKMLLRGICDLSFIDEVMKDSHNCKIGERRGLRTLGGIVAYYEKTTNFEIIIVSTYLQGKEEERLDERIVALSNLLINMIAR